MGPWPGTTGELSLLFPGPERTTPYKWPRKKGLCIVAILCVRSSAKRRFPGRAACWREVARPAEAPSPPCLLLDPRPPETASRRQDSTGRAPSGASASQGLGRRAQTEVARPAEAPSPPCLLLDPRPPETASRRQDSTGRCKMASAAGVRMCLAMCL